MKSAQNPVDFDDRLSRIHNFLYANGPSRVDFAIAREFSNIVTALVSIATNGRPLLLETPELKQISVADEGTCMSIAQVVRDAFDSIPESRRHGSIESSNLCIATVVAELNEIDLLHSDRDWIGDAYEKFRSLEAKRLGGQFFNDQRVTDLAMELLEFNEDSQSLMDICAGTGGFLLAAARRISRNAAKIPQLIGVEIDIELVRAANNTLSTWSETCHVIQENSLAGCETWSTDEISVADNSQPLLASNPPFGTKIRIRDKQLLSKFELPSKWAKSSAGRWSATPGCRPLPPDLLFVERNVQLAKPGGLIALVLPYQILSGPQLEYVREWIIRNCRVRAVIDCPSETFQPWTGTKTSLVLLEKRHEPLTTSVEAREEEVFMAIAKRIGHDRRGTPVLTEDGARDTDLPSIGEAYKAYRRGESRFDQHHDAAFVLPFDRVLVQGQLRLNSSSYSREATEAFSHIKSLSDRRGWRLSTIGSEVDSIFFPNRFKRTYIDKSDDGAIPFLGGSQILSIEQKDGKFVYRDDPNVSACVVREGWVLVTRSGSTGIVSSVPKSWDGLAVSEHVIRIVPKPGGLPGGYIQAFLRSEVGQDLISAGVFGSVIDEITPEHIAELPVLVPTDMRTIERVAGIDAQMKKSQKLRAQLAQLMRDSDSEMNTILS